MRKQLRMRRILATVLAILLALLPVPASAQQTSDMTVYEHHEPTPTGNGSDIYGSNWRAQSFFTGNISHTVEVIRIPISVTGTPEYIEVALVEGNETGAIACPSGGDITYVTKYGTDLPSGDVFSWVSFDIADQELAGNASYCIVVRAPEGSDASNYIRWEWQVAGAYTDGTASSSSDGGSTWAYNVSDHLFQIWGAATLLVRHAEVFTGYLEDDDMLFCVEYLNICPPYYDDYDPARYFQLRLLDTDSTTVLAAGPARGGSQAGGWGDGPASLYLSASSALALEEGVTYYLRLQGISGSQPYSEYRLTGADWRGSDLDLLDGWAIRTAHSMGDYDSATYTVTIADKGEVLNTTAGVLFDRGIPYLYETRPDLFEAAPRGYSGYPYGTPDIGIGGDWEVAMGSDFVTSMEQAGTVFGLTSKEMATGLVIAVFLTLALICTYVGSAGMGAVLAMPALAFAAWAGFFSASAFAIVIIAYAFIFSVFFWWRPT